jgi:plasmid maintenance system antidote protein VapI
MKTISADEARKILEDMVEVAGSQKAIARELEITPSYLSDILDGRRDISDKIARKLGYAKETVYAPIN